MGDVKVVVRYSAPIETNRYNDGEGESANALAYRINSYAGGYVNHSDVVPRGARLSDPGLKVREAYVLMYVNQAAKDLRDIVGDEEFLRRIDLEYTLDRYGITNLELQW